MTNTVNELKETPLFTPTLPSPFKPALPALALRLIISYQASNPGLGQGRDVREPSCLP
jgi:hypothetical protein